MCFSATADLAAGIVIAAVGVDCVRHVRRPREIALGVLPLVLAVHQLTEAFVWWGLEGRVPGTVSAVATGVYLVIAFVVLPVYFPVAVLLVEPSRPRRVAMTALTAVGALVAVDLAVALLRGPVTAELQPYHIAYGIDTAYGGVVVVGYVVATCGAALLSSSVYLRAFGALNLAAVVALTWLDRDGLASLWCVWAALASITVALHLRRARRPSTSETSTTVPAT